jgi:hypothetical protein
MYSSKPNAINYLYCHFGYISVVKSVFFSLTTLLINYSTSIQTNNFKLLIKMKGFYALAVTSLLGQGVLAASPKLNQYASIDDWHVTLRYILTNVIPHRVDHPIELTTRCDPTTLHPRYLNTTPTKFDEK